MVTNYQGNNVHPELFIARDVSDMAQDPDALEYLSSICFNMARMSGNVLDWDNIFSVLDRAYYSKNHILVAQLDDTYRKITAQIEESQRAS